MSGCGAGEDDEFVVLHKPQFARLLYMNPVCFLTTHNQDGEDTNVMTISWLTAISNHGHFICSTHQARTSAGNIEQSPLFTLSIAGTGHEELLWILTEAWTLEDWAIFTTCMSLWFLVYCIGVCWIDAGFGWTPAKLKAMRAAGDMEKYEKVLAKRSKAHGWVLVLVSSSLFALIGTPLMLDRWHYDSHESFFSEFVDHDQPTPLGIGTRTVTISFMAFLIVDLIVGSTFHPHTIQLLTGWVHHLVYVFFTLWCVSRHSTAMIVLFMIEEIPTAILALGSINDAWRSDFWFGTTLIGFRVAWHFWGVWGVFWHTGGYAFIPAVLTCFLHTWWAYSWVMGAMKRCQRGDDQEAKKDR